MTKEYPNLKIIRVKNAAGKTVEYYRHRITGRAYGSNRERALRLWAADQLALDGPEGRNRVPGTVANAIKQFQESKVWETIAESTRTLWRPYFADLDVKCQQVIPGETGSWWIAVEASMRSLAVIAVEPGPELPGPLG